MKIALCCKVYPTARPGGMGFVCQDRARALAKLGHEVHVLTTGRVTHQGETLVDAGVEVHHMPCKSVHYSQEFVDHCLIHCRQWLPGIIHCDSFGVDYRPWWKSCQARTAVTMHGFCWGAYFTQWNLYYRHGGRPPQLDADKVAHEREMIASFNVQIGISLHEHWMLKCLMGIFSAKLVYNPIAEYFFSHPNAPLPSIASPRFLCAAVSGHYERGFAIAAQAAKLAGAKLVVADSPREQMPSLIDSCHALVLPTAYCQGLDLTVAEALVRNRPVVATATGSYLREAESGGIYEKLIKLIPLTDINALAADMKLPMTWVDKRWAKLQLHYPQVHAEKWLEAILG